MINSDHLVILTLDEQRYGLRLSVVKRIVRVVEISRLPKAPEIILGIINLQGKIIPVVDIRKRFRVMEREIRLSDQLIIVSTAKRSLALVVDKVTEVVDCDRAKIVAAEQVCPGLEYLEGVVKLEDGLVFVHDLNTFLSLDEEKALDEAIES